MNCEQCGKFCKSKDPIWVAPDLCRACGWALENMRAERDRLRAALVQLADMPVIDTGDGHDYHECAWCKSDACLSDKIIHDEGCGIRAALAALDSEDT